MTNVNVGKSCSEVSNFADSLSPVIKWRIVYLRRSSRELSCLSSGLPTALLRSLFSSSTARIYSPCSSLAWYVALTNLDSGFTRSTSDDFFNGTEINVAISARVLPKAESRVDVRTQTTARGSLPGPAQGTSGDVTGGTARRIAPNQWRFYRKGSILVDGKALFLFTYL